MSKRSVFSLLALLLALGGAYWLGATRGTRPTVDTDAAPRAVYQCSMHPQVVQDHPGN